MVSLTSVHSCLHSWSHPFSLLHNFPSSKEQESSTPVVGFWQFPVICPSMPKWRRVDTTVTLERGQRLSLFLLWWWWFFFFFFFWSHHIPCEILVSLPGVKPTVEAQGLNHWTAREVPSLAYFEFHWMPPTPTLLFPGCLFLILLPSSQSRWPGLSSLASMPPICSPPTIS